MNMATWDRSLDRLIQAHDDVITAIEMRGDVMFTASFDNTVKVWHAPSVGAVTLTRALECCLPTSLAPLRGAPEAFASASLDGVLRLWGGDSHVRKVLSLSASLLTV